MVRLTIFFILSQHPLFRHLVPVWRSADLRYHAFQCFPAEETFPYHLSPETDALWMDKDAQSQFLWFFLPFLWFTSPNKGWQQSGTQMLAENWSFWMEFHATNVIRKQEKRSLSANPANIIERLFSVSGRIWTSDPSLRRRVLYPAELRRHMPQTLDFTGFLGFFPSAIYKIINSFSSCQSTDF